MYSYSAYGLIIKCAVPLPDLVESDGPADVVMRFGKVPLTDRPQSNSDFSLQLKGIELISLIEVWGRVKLFMAVKLLAILKRVWTRTPFRFWL